MVDENALCGACVEPRYDNVGSEMHALAHEHVARLVENDLREVGCVPLVQVAGKDDALAAVLSRTLSGAVDDECI